MTGFDDRFGAAPAPSGPPAPTGSSGSAGPTPQSYAGPMSQPYPGSGGQPAFGAAPVFGTPAQPGQTWGTPPYQRDPDQDLGRPADRQRRRRRNRRRGGARFGWNYWQAHRAIGVPTTSAAYRSSTARRLTGLPKSRPPASRRPTARRWLSPSTRRPRARTWSCSPASGAGSRASTPTWPAAERGAPTSVTTLRDLHRGIVCERTSSHLTEAVVVHSTTMTVAQVSAMLDEAWAKA